MITVETAREPKSGATLAALVGEASMATLPDLEAALTRVAAGRPALLIVDLSKLTFLSSLGIGALVTLQRSIVRSGGHVILAGARANVQTAFEHAHLDRFFEMYRTVDQAVAEMIATGRAHDCEAGAH